MNIFAGTDVFEKNDGILCAADVEKYVWSYRYFLF